MGIYLSTFVKQLSRVFAADKGSSIIIIGLASAGKSSLVEVLKHGDQDWDNHTIHTNPTMTHAVETIRYKNLISLHLWDLTGQDKLRFLWSRYFLTAQAVIFVIDSSDSDRFPEVLKTLEWVILADELRFIPILVLANKQDLVTEEKASKMMELFDTSHISERPIKVFPCCITRREGVDPAMTWLIEALKQRN